MGVNLNDLARRVRGVLTGSPEEANQAHALDSIAQALAESYQRRAALREEDDKHSDIMPGDLMEIVSPHGLDEVVLGRISPSSDQVEDPAVQVGTLCVVQRPYDDPSLSSPAHVVLLEHMGTPSEFWLYARELKLVSR